MEAWVWDVVNTGEDICEPGLRIDIVQTGGDDQEYMAAALSPTIGAGEQPGFPAQSYTAQSAFCRIIRQTDPAVFKKCRECIDTPEKIGHGLGKRVFGRHAPAGIAHPVEEIRHQWGDALLADGQPMRGGTAVDRAFGVEDGVDPAHGLYGKGSFVLLGNFEQPLRPCAQHPADTTGAG